MNRGKVVGMVILWTLLVSYLSMMPFLIEIPKLASRVDELTYQLKARDQAAEDTSLALRTRQTEIEAKAKEVKALTEQVTTLEKTSQEKDKAIAALQVKKPIVPSRSQEYRDVSTLGNGFEVTWYNDYGYTKSGRFVAKGITVAVDPRVIALGSWVRLEFPDGSEMIRQAQDTGSAVKGHIIDVYDSAPDSELFRRGRAHGVKVTLLKKE